MAGARAGLPWLAAIVSIACDGGSDGVAPSDGRAPDSGCAATDALGCFPEDAGKLSRARALCEAGCALTAQTCPDSDLERCRRGCEAAAGIEPCAREFLDLMQCLAELPAGAFDCARGARVVNDGSCRAEQAAYFDCAFVPTPDGGG